MKNIIIAITLLFANCTYTMQQSPSPLDTIDSETDAECVERTREKFLQHESDSSDSPCLAIDMIDTYWRDSSTMLTLERKHNTFDGKKGFTSVSAILAVYDLKQRYALSEKIAQINQGLEDITHFESLTDVRHIALSYDGVLLATLKHEMVFPQGGIERLDWKTVLAVQKLRKPGLQPDKFEIPQTFTIPHFFGNISTIDFNKQGTKVIVHGLDYTKLKPAVQVANLDEKATRDHLFFELAH